uniref:Uncharacterized protein n=1 Tax=Cannabis sativa TaxID=3483 RepID=A0A803RBE4_CANSA
MAMSCFNAICRVIASLHCISTCIAIYIAFLIGIWMCSESEIFHDSLSIMHRFIPCDMKGGLWPKLIDILKIKYMIILVFLMSCILELEQ